MGRYQVTVILLLLFIASHGRSGPLRHPDQRLRVKGNRVFVDEVYQTIADLSPAKRLTAATAKKVKHRVRSFLLNSGYVLAKVRAGARNGKIYLNVDEGKLSRIVFVGRGVMTTLRLQAGLSLPYQIFNRPEFERRLKRLARQRNIEGARYELIRAERVRHKGTQIDEIPIAPGIALGSADEGRFELHIFLPKGKRRQGGDLSINLIVDDVKLAYRYDKKRLFFRNDRWTFKSSTRVGLIEDVVGKEKVKVDQGLLSFRWFTPLFETSKLRPFFDLALAADRIERRDLLLDSAWWSRSEASLNVSYQLSRYGLIGVGGGLQIRNLSRVNQQEIPPLVVGNFDEKRAFGRMVYEHVFDLEDMRKDRRHQLSGDFRYFSPGTEADDKGGFFRLQLDFRKVFGIGWHDLWVRTAGAVVFGEFTLADEEPITRRYLRGVFNRDVYSRGIGALRLDFRYSLSRDLIRIGLFHDFAVFRESEILQTEKKVNVGNAFGPGVFMLLWDSLQFDIMYSVGFLSDGENDSGITLLLQQAF